MPGMRLSLNVPVDAPGTPNVFHDPATSISLRMLTSILRGLKPGVR